MENKSKMHLLLDMDGTLIDDCGKGVARPYLKEFLKFAFDNFETVSIWTSATTAWYEKIEENIFWKILEELNCEFYKIYTRGCCNFSTICTNSTGPVATVIKFLPKLWETERCMNENNTIIIDNSETYSYFNHANAIVVKTFMPKGESSEGDDILSLLVNDLKIIVDDHKKEENIDLSRYPSFLFKVTDGSLQYYSHYNSDLWELV